jgi:putative membrane protein
MLHGIVVRWLLNALALLLVAWVVPGIELEGFGTALFAALVVGLLNATLGLLLHIIFFPLTILTLGLAYLAVNALVLMLAGKLVPGFRVAGFWSALFASAALYMLSCIIIWIL